MIHFNDLVAHHMVVIKIIKPPEPSMNRLDGQLRQKSEPT